MADISNIQQHDYQLSECDSRHVLKENLLPFESPRENITQLQAFGCAVFFITHNHCHTCSSWLDQEFGHILHKQSRQTTMFGHGKWQNDKRFECCNGRFKNWIVITYIESSVIFALILGSYLCCVCWVQVTL